MKFAQSVALLAVSLSPAVAVNAQQAGDALAELRQEVAELRSDYENRLRELEERLARAETLAGVASRDAGEAIELAEQTAIDQNSGSSAANTFNPAIGAVLGGSYAKVDNGWEQIPGFQSGGEIGPGGSGFSVGEAEVNLKANVDDKFFGNLTVGIHEDEGEAEVGVEEAWLQSTRLPAGVSVTAGRFFSATGYLNGFHFHADDFVDRPLPYQAFLGGRYTVDGLQARWIIPSKWLFEVGTEVNWGGGFPATANERTSPGAWTFFTKTGGDIGNGHSWQAGLAHTRADASDRGATAFSGMSDLSIADFVWKWAPVSGASAKSFKLQGEYFARTEDGDFDDLPYNGEQAGWYLQGVYQFARLWRVGVRHDAVDSDNGPLFIGTELEDPDHSPYRNSVMLDWSPSEFSRLRMQYTRDRVLSYAENQWYLQYIMSIGAHGAHQY